MEDNGRKTCGLPKSVDILKIGYTQLIVYKKAGLTAVKADYLMKIDEMVIFRK